MSDFAVPNAKPEDHMPHLMNRGDIRARFDAERKIEARVIEDDRRDLARLMQTAVSAMSERDLDMILREIARLQDVVKTDPRDHPDHSRSGIFVSHSRRKVVIQQDKTGQFPDSPKAGMRADTTADDTWAFLRPIEIELGGKLIEALYQPPFGNPEFLAIHAERLERRNLEMPPLERRHDLMRIIRPYLRGGPMTTQTTIELSKNGRRNPVLMRVLVCGGRNYTDWRAVSDALRRLHDNTPIEIIIHGCASGADTLAARWAFLAGICVHAFGADWAPHGKAAGPIRNQQMLDKGRPNLVVAFPGGKGTADMLRRAEAAGVKIWKPLEDAAG